MDAQMDALDAAYRALGQLRAMADVMSLLEGDGGEPLPLRAHTLEGIAGILEDTADAIDAALALIC